MEPERRDYMKYCWGSSWTQWGNLLEYIAEAEEEIQALEKTQPKTNAGKGNLFPPRMNHGIPTCYGCNEKGHVTRNCLDWLLKFESIQTANAIHSNVCSGCKGKQNRPEKCIGCKVIMQPGSAGLCLKHCKKWLTEGPNEKAKILLDGNGCLLCTAS